MDFRDSLTFNLNTAFKRGIEEAPYSGHALVKMAEWSRDGGFKKFDKATYGIVAIPCPVIAIVDEKIRESNLILNIVGTKVVGDGTYSFKQIGRTITKNKYKVGTTTRTTLFEVPRFTRQYGTFLISGLENQIFEITNITSNVTENQSGGKITFYGLASDGSKVLYYLGMFKIHNMIKEIINSIWIAPIECVCGGDGCTICNTYGYSGFNATKGIQIAKGYDVKVTRNKFDSYPLTDAQYQQVWKFVNKAWTQKWWVTPTVKEIKRLFAHFYNTTEEKIYITERYHFSMPHWDISVPIDQEEGSPFPTGDRSLMKFVAQSVTPAGVNVFIGFYKIIELGDFTGVESGIPHTQVGNKLISHSVLMSATDSRWHRFGQRYRVWNGWCDCVDDFERTSGSPNWSSGGIVDILNVNDLGRHWCQLSDNSYIQTSGAFTPTRETGVVELWIHPEKATRYGGIDPSGWAFYVDFRNSGFYDNKNNLLRNAMPHSDYHLRIDFISDVNLCSGVVGYMNNVFINNELMITGVCFNNAFNTSGQIRIETWGSGQSYVDNFGGDWVSGYTANVNWQRLYPCVWGMSHANCEGGVSGLYEYYFRPNKFWNGTGVCV